MFVVIGSHIWLQMELRWIVDISQRFELVVNRLVSGIWRWVMVGSWLMCAAIETHEWLRENRSEFVGIDWQWNATVSHMLIIRILG